MRALLTIAALALSAPAFAQTAPPKSTPPVEHAVTLTDADLGLLGFLAQRTGERCAQDPAFCQAQLLLNDLVKRIDAQVKAEKK